MILLYIVMAVILGVLLVCLVIGYGTMRFVIYPKRYTYEETTEDQRNKNLWGDYDSYEKEAFDVTCPDGYILHGELIRNDSKKFVIITHGYTINLCGSVKYANIFYRLGYNVYLYDLRHFGKNKECFCSMGRNEAKDIITVQETLLKRFGEDITIGLHGESLGCASSMLALGLSQRFAFLVADCGFVDLKVLLEDQAGKMLHLPSFMAYFTDFWMKLLHHYKFSQIRPIDVMKDNKVPVLFFHGADDDFIVPEHSRRAYAACSAYKKLCIVEGAGHAQSYERDPVGYARTIETFLAATNGCE